jgi:osmotically-inducible protein OsmY
MNGRKRWLFPFALAGGLLLAGAANASQPYDAWITTKLKLRMLATPGVDGGSIDVDTYDGLVTLHGVVSDATEKNRAGEWAEAADGVRGVRNLLAVVPESERALVAERDRRIERELRALLDGDAELLESSIEVASVHDGIVVLSGEAASFDAHRRALGIAAEVRGVRLVASEIHSPDPAGDAALWEEAGAVPDEEDAGLSIGAADALVGVKARLRLMAGPARLAPGEVLLDTHDGVVRVFGVVRTQGLKDLVEEELLAVDGVRRVENHLQVRPALAAADAGRDQALRERVSERLEARDSLRDAVIEVEAERGVVRLRGAVASATDRATAVSLAADTWGVHAVVDELRIEPRS